MSIEHSPAREGARTGTDNLSPALITDIEVGVLFGCSRATVWRRVADGTLPKPVRIGGMTRFIVVEIEAVLDRAKAARDEAA